MDRSTTSLAALLWLALASAAFAQPRPSNRAEATAVIAEMRRIVTPDGVDRAEIRRIGGIDQVVSIRGRDRRNPLLLVLHGGPGFPETPLAWWNTRDLEEYFTVVHWDQRGSGKTYLLNPPEAVAPTMTPDTFVSDTEALVAWLRTEFGKQKVFVLGHSWGSYVGLEFARRRPARLHAYIGVGQATDIREGERRGNAHALAAARREGNAEAVRELESIAPYAQSRAPIAIHDIALERQWSDYYGGVMAYRHGQTNDVAARLSPDYADDIATRIFEGNGFSQARLFTTILDLDLRNVTRLDCPVLLLEGRHDRTVNSEVAHEWFERLQAPEKQFVWFEHSGHEVMSEEPAKVLVSLLRYARPLAVRAGDGPVLD